jgi:hypothetical protein
MHKAISFDLHGTGADDGDAVLAALIVPLPDIESPFFA